MLNTGVLRWELRIWVHITRRGVYNFLLTSIGGLYTKILTYIVSFSLCSTYRLYICLWLLRALLVPSPQTNRGSAPGPLCGTCVPQTPIVPL